MNDSRYASTIRIPTPSNDSAMMEYRQPDIVLTPSQHQHHGMMQPPLIIRTSPSYVSTTRSVSNRSNISSSKHSNSMRGYGMETFEAERIACATNQAQAAARSILLTGGTQASALSTAKAAAKSALKSDFSHGMKPPLGSTKNGGFLGRRKNKQQAEIIASMALVSVNQSFGHENDLSSSVSRYAQRDKRDSEIPDDMTNFRSLGPSVYGRSHSVRSYIDLNPAHPYGYYDYSNEPKHVMNPTPIVSDHNTASDTKLMTSQSQQNIYPDASRDIVIKDSKSRSATKETDEPMVKNASMNESSSQKHAMVEDLTSHSSEAKKFKTKIPEEMPMPRSMIFRGTAPLKGSNENQESKKHVVTPHSRYQTEAQLSCYTDSSASHTNSWTNSYARHTNDENTADFTKDTFESVVEGNRKATRNEPSSQFGTNFFSNMDPFVYTFSEVFSCTPEPRFKQKYGNDKKNTRQHQSRDATETTTRNSIHNEERSEPPSVAILNYSDPKNARSNESVSLLNTSDVHSVEEVDDRKNNVTPDISYNAKEKSSNGLSMEQLVLRALSAVSPKAASSNRPRLHIKPMKKSTLSNSVVPLSESNINSSKRSRSKISKTVSKAQIQPNQLSNQPISLTTSKGKESLSKSTSNERRAVESSSNTNSHRISGSSDDCYSISDDSVTVKPDTTKMDESGPKNGPHALRRFPSWFHRPKSTKNASE